MGRYSWRWKPSRQVWPQVTQRGYLHAQGNRDKDPLLWPRHRCQHSWLSIPYKVVHAECGQPCKPWAWQGGASQDSYMSLLPRPEQLRWSVRTGCELTALVQTPGLWPLMCRGQERERQAGGRSFWPHVSCLRGGSPRGHFIILQLTDKSQHSCK